MLSDFGTVAELFTAIMSGVLDIVGRFLIARIALFAGAVFILLEMFMWVFRWRKNVMNAGGYRMYYGMDTPRAVRRQEKADFSRRDKVDPARVDMAGMVYVDGSYYHISGRRQGKRKKLKKRR